MPPRSHLTAESEDVKQGITGLRREKWWKQFSGRVNGLRKTVQLLDSMKGSFQTQAHEIKGRPADKAACFSPARFSSIIFTESRRRARVYQICGFAK